MADGFGPVNEDTRVVVEAANALGLREVDFFRLAYRKWFSRDIKPEKLEKVFAAYMFHEVVPPWVRHCAREALNRDGMGMLDPVKFGARDFFYQSRVPRVGKGFLLAAGAMMFIVYLSLLATDHRFSHPSCPGHYTNPTITNWVYMIKGQQPPICDKVGRLE